MLWLLVWTLTATAGTTRWEDVLDAADAAWSRAEGASLQDELDGADRARRVAASLPSLSAGSRLGSLSNQEATASLEAPLGLGLRPRRQWSAEAEALRAEGESDRLAFMDRVLQAWLAWWTARELAEHLGEWSAEVEATLAPLDAAVADGVAAPLDAEDLRAELATVRAEAAAARAQAVRARAALEALLGEAGVPEADGVHVHELDVSTLDNPWAALVGRAADAPEIRAAEARAAALDAEARALGTWRPVAQVGVAWADGNGPFEPLAIVGIQAPLRPAGLAAARQARAQASAELRRAGWRTDRIAGGWRAEAVSFDADRERILRLDRDVVGPLARRLERLEAAFDEGLVPADRVIRARRDHHEAEHERLVLTARLLDAMARAEALRRLLETS